MTTSPRISHLTHFIEYRVHDTPAVDRIRLYGSNSRYGYIQRLFGGSVSYIFHKYSFVTSSLSFREDYVCIEPRFFVIHGPSTYLTQHPRPGPDGLGPPFAHAAKTWMTYPGVKCSACSLADAFSQAQIACLPCVLLAWRQYAAGGVYHSPY